MYNEITPAMIKKIHFLTGTLKMEDYEYRCILEGFGADSSKKLTRTEGAELIGKLEAMAITAGHGIKMAPKNDLSETAGNRSGKYEKRFDHLGCREDMATPEQLRHLEGLWVEVSSKKTLAEKQKAFNWFLHERFHVSRIEWVRADQVSKIKRALAAMKKRKDEPETDS